MQRKPTDDKQLLGSFFAIMIVLFGLGSSYAGKISKPQYQIVFSELSSSRITADEQPEGHQSSDFLVTVYNNTPGSGIVSSIHTVGKTFYLALARVVVCFDLPGLHAP